MSFKIQGHLRYLLALGTLVLNTAGCPKPGITDSENPAGLSLARSGPATYVPGDTLDITIHMNAEAGQTIAALGLTESIPEGWTFAGVLGASGGPGIAPQMGAEGDLEFAWITTPSFPYTFSYALMVPFATESTAEITGQVTYRQGAGPFTLDPVTTTYSLDNPAGVVLERTTDATYFPGEQTTVLITVDATDGDSISAIGMEETVPKGWSFVSATGISGATPPILPETGASGTLDFVWIVPPAFPYEFEYTLAVPENQTGTAVISGYVAYRQNAGPLGTGRLESTLEAPSP